MSGYDSFFDPYAPPPPRKKGRGALIAILVIVALLVAGGGTAWYLYYRHQQQIEAENRNAQRLADTFAQDLGGWQAQLAKVKPPAKDVVLTSLYKPGIEAAQQRKDVGEGCAKFAAYGKSLTALPAPPAIAAIDPEIAQRVPAYTAARAEAEKRAGDFAKERADAAGQLSQLATFCQFFDKEAQLSAQLTQGEATWKKSLWPQGFSQVIGNYRYTCGAKAGCLPVESQWGELAGVYHSSFVEPNSKLRALYQDSCPYDDLAKQCQAIAATLGKVVDAEESFESALKAKDSPALDKAKNGYSAEDARSDLLTQLTKLDPGLRVLPGSDPAATVIFDKVAANVAALQDAAPQPPDPGTIAS